MKLFHHEDHPLQQFSMSSGQLPIDGPRSSLAGVAEKGARLDVLGQGSFTNVGSKESPRWVRLYAKEPTSSAGEWRPVEEGS